MSINNETKGICINQSGISGHCIQGYLKMLLKNHTSALNSVVKSSKMGQNRSVYTVPLYLC